MDQLSAQVLGPLAALVITLIAVIAFAQSRVVSKGQHLETVDSLIRLYEARITEKDATIARLISERNTVLNLLVGFQGTTQTAVGLADRVTSKPNTSTRFSE